MKTPSFELQPTLRGNLLELIPLKSNDFDELYAVAADPLIWEQHPQKDRFQKEVFQKFFIEALASKGAFIVRSFSTGNVIGSSRFYDYRPTKSEVVIGYTFLARSVWGGTYNAELKKLMLDHAFQFVENVIFHVDPKNIRSQKAMLKIGGEPLGEGLIQFPNLEPKISLFYRISRK